MKKTFLMLIAMISVLLSGCRSNTEIPQEEQREEITLVYYNWQNNPAFVERFIERVHEEYNHITIEPQATNWDSMHQTLEIKMASNQMPEIIDFKGRDVLLYAQSGSLIDLTDQPFMNSIDIYAKETVRYRGNDYSLPYAMAYHGILYNKDLFQKYNLVPPTTYQELIEVCEKFKQVGINPFATHFKDTIQIANIERQLAMGEVFARDPQWGNKLMSDKISFFESEAYRFVFGAVKDIYTYSNSDSFEISGADCEKLFVDGKAAMLCSGTWALAAINELDNEFDIGIFSMPTQYGQGDIILEVYHAFVGSAKTTYISDVINVLELIANDVELATVYTQMDKLPLTVKGSKKTDLPIYDDIDELIKNGQCTEARVGNSQIVWEYQDAFCGYIAKWLFGEITLDEALIATDKYKERLQ